MVAHILSGFSNNCPLQNSASYIGRELGIKLKGSNTVYQIGKILN